MIFISKQIMNVKDKHYITIRSKKLERNKAKKANNGIFGISQNLLRFLIKCGEIISARVILLKWELVIIIDILYPLLCSRK